VADVHVFKRMLLDVEGNGRPLCRLRNAGPMYLAVSLAECIFHNVVSILGEQERSEREDGNGAKRSRRCKGGNHGFTAHEAAVHNRSREKQAINSLSGERSSHTIIQRRTTKCDYSNRYSALYVNRWRNTSGWQSALK